jgi:hypothetical protein
MFFPKNLIPWRDSYPGLLIPEADAMSIAPLRQGEVTLLSHGHFILMYTSKCNYVDDALSEGSSRFLSMFVEVYICITSVFDPRLRQIF